MVTTDKNLRYQQDLSGRRLAILVLPTTSWPKLKGHATHIAVAIDALEVGAFKDLALPTGS